MNITVSSLSQNQEGKQWVEFSSSFGRAKAFWVGQKPRVNSSYEVEVEITKVLRWGYEIQEYPKQLFQMSMNGDSIS